jgi:serine/threonine-protein kinase RsbT
VRSDGAGGPGVETSERVPIRGEDDIVYARQRAREMARQLGFGMLDQSRIATAVSELTRNVVRYALGARGEALIRGLEVDAGRRVGIEIVIADEGPGIANLDLAMSEGFTSGSGLGMGLPGAKRLMDEMAIQSEVGVGTTVTVRKWRR